MSEKVPELTNGEFDEFIKEGTVLIDFFAEWCMPCLMMAPVLDDIADRFDGKIKVGKVNVEDAPDLAQKFNVSSIPNLVVLKDGKQVGNMVGAQSAEDLEEKLGKYL